MHSTGTHVPGNALGTGEGRIPGTGTTGTRKAIPAPLAMKLVAVEQAISLA